MFAIAARHGSTSPHLVEAVSPATLRDGEILCRTVELGICGTDRDILHSANPWLPAGEQELVLGHECLAQVESIGTSVSDFAIGDWVVPVVRRPTGTFARRSDMLPFGDWFIERGIYRAHGFSSPLWVDEPQHLCKIPQSILDVAVLTEPLAVAEKGFNEALAIQKARLEEDIWLNAPPRVLVTGMGPIGFAAILGAVARDWPVTLIGRDASNSFRAELARELGANYRHADEVLYEPNDVERDGYDLLLECTGSDEVALLASQHLASCAVGVWLGSVRIPQPGTHNVQLWMRDALVRNHAYLGSVNAAARDFHDAIAHLVQMNEQQPAPLRKMLTCRVSQADSLWHYEHREPQGIKTVIEYRT